MNRDINNFRETTNSIIEDIQVTEELKLSTLKKCKEQKKYNLKPFFVTAASVAIMTFSIVSYKFIFHKADSSLTYNKETPTKSVTFDNTNDKHSNNKNDVTNSTKDTSSEASSEKQIQQNNQSVVKNKNDAKSIDLSKNDNKTSVNSSKNKSEEYNINTSLPDNKQINNPSENVSLNNNASVEKDVSSSTSGNSSAKDSVTSPISNEVPKAKASLSESSKPISMADAENFWGGKLLMPSYIPQGFELTDISLPKNDSKEIYVKLNYSFKNIYFKILQNKSTTSTSYVGKTSVVNGSKVYITKNKDTSNPSILTTEINFVKNNIQYNITGNLQEDELIKIIKSIN